MEIFLGLAVLGEFPGACKLPGNQQDPGAQMQNGQHLDQPVGGPDLVVHNNIQVQAPVSLLVAADHHIGDLGTLLHHPFWGLLGREVLFVAEVLFVVGAGQDELEAFDQGELNQGVGDLLQLMQLGALSQGVGHLLQLMQLDAHGDVLGLEGLSLDGQVVGLFVDPLRIPSTVWM